MFVEHIKDFRFTRGKVVGFQLGMRDGAIRQRRACQQQGRHQQRDRLIYDMQAFH